MSRVAAVPPQLTTAPFTRQEARQHGLSDPQLRGSSWRRIDRGVFAWHEIADRHLVRLKAVLLRVPAGTVFSGRTAGWLHGLDLDPFGPLEVTVPTGCKVTRRYGTTVHRSADVERSVARGFPVTSRLQTVVDLARRPPMVEALVILDMALHRRMVDLSSLRRWAGENPGRRGVAFLREALELAEPATESPMETRLRLLLVLAGLPKPRVQPVLRDSAGAFLARPDLYYADHRLAIEYDGSSHKDSVATDNRRQNRLVDAEHRILRFTAGDVFMNPGGVVSLVRGAIARPLL